MTERIVSNRRIEEVVAPDWLFRVMTLFHLPVAWPAGLMGSAILALAGITGLLWWLVTGDWTTGLLAAVGLLAFFGWDTAVLQSLPRRRISFGSWRAQFFPLALPRAFATVALSFAALLIGAWAALALALLVQLAGSAALWRGAVCEPARLTLTRLDVTSDRLPSGTPPTRLLHISDLHVERPGVREAQLLQLIECMQPDLILITGDYFNTSYNRDRQTLEQVRALLGQLWVPYGVYATLGTPVVDRREWAAPLFDGLPITLLRDAWQTVDLDKGRRLTLLGLDCTHDLPADADHLARLNATAPNNAPQVLLYHSPELMPQAVGHGIDLYLCGHTHGGQVRLPLIGPLLTSSQLGRRYVMGSYHEGRTHLYVSRGVGLEGLSAPRVRFLAPPEITLVTIHPG